MHQYSTVRLIGDQSLPLDVMLNQRQARMQECRKHAAELVGLPELSFLHILDPKERVTYRGCPIFDNKAYEMSRISGRQRIMGNSPFSSPRDDGFRIGI